MTSKPHWFMQEVFLFRTIASQLWAVLLVPAGVYGLLLTTQVDLLHPWRWIVGCLFEALSPYNWGYLLLLWGVVVVAGTSHARHLTVSPKIPQTRLARLVQLLSPSSLMHAGMHVVMAMVMSYCAAALIGPQFSSLSLPCQGSDQNMGGTVGPVHCLNEKSVFVVFSGAFLGLCYSVQYFLHSRHRLQFPVIQQAKFFRVRTLLPRLVVDSASRVVRLLPGYYLGYYLLGHGVKTWMCALLRLKPSPVDIGSLHGLLDVGLLWQTAVGGTFMFCLLDTSWLMLHIFHAQVFKFEVASSLADQTDRYLSDAVQCQDVPLVQYLGFLDLSLLAQFSPQRRRHIFSLSQPGGHPYVWKTVSTSSLAVLDSLTNRLAACRQNIGVTGQRLSPDPTRVQGSQKVGVGGGQAPGKLEKVTLGLRRTPVLAYFLQQLPEAASAELFQDAQLLVWVLEGLSHLVAASYTEDTYGVVQKSLPDILTALIGLHEALDRHFKMPLAGSRPSQHAWLSCQRDVSSQNMRFSLLPAATTALYHIVNVFGKHVESIPLSTEHKQKLRLFLPQRDAAGIPRS
ncbi:nucleoporin NDC1-like [Branchiostoma floridae]|uniref:Nucleoporin NDC1 n=1 Tax=Branchiostoma floridae TaxID=7739 RepID=A0A9J7M1N0_BRAFL|nr:nucleoporin NDC1-like [Branchiostoma floridae]